jgi:hypothetical protein
MRRVANFTVALVLQGIGKLFLTQGLPIYAVYCEKRKYIGP